MRVIIISDMEGVSGICKWEQVNGGESLYEQCRVLYTEEINACVRGAVAGGATEVVVMDCHGAGRGWTFNSLIPERLDERCEWVVQQRWTEHTETLAAGCDAALFVGMHAMAGAADGVLNHTVSSSSWHELRFDGVPVGEVGINAALCGHFGCPVLMVTGDHAVCRESRALLGPALVTVEVKRGYNRYSARHVPPARARAMIELAAAKVVRERPAVAPYVPARPCSIAVTYSTSDGADKAVLRPGVTREDGRTVTSRAGDWWAAWSQLYL